MSVKSAYFAGGCFWCIEPMFQTMAGVEDVISGYCGGDEENPRYEDVKAQRTGHRETILIEYDDEKLSYGDLLEVFLRSVDVFDGGGQFIDRGRSYTLAVYYTNEVEKAAAIERLEKIEADTGEKPAVAVEEFKSFWPAEEYHQDYFLKHPEELRRELEESGRTERNI